MDTHADRVSDVAAQIRARPSGAKITFRKATPSHSIRDQGYKRGLHAIDVSALTHILEIDTDRGLVRAEGQVTMGQLAAATLSRGFLPAVVPEFRNFTVSGLINGEGIQSSSHRYGVFTHAVESVDIITAAGDVVSASRSGDPELVEALRESLGTLGVVVSATIRLVPAKPFVRLTYRRFETLDEYVSAFRESLGGPAFHEGVIYGPRCHVLLTGELVDDPGGLPVFDVDREGEQYYFQRVRDLATSAVVSHDMMSTLSYLARAERGLWWMLECHVDFPLLSETTWGRKRLDAAVAKAYAKGGLAAVDVTVEQRDRCLISQDMAVRIDRLAEGVRWIQQHLDVFPIWNCAVRLRDHERPDYANASHLVDLGIYGEPMARGYRRIAAMRALQRLADAPSLWGVSFLSWPELCAKFPGRCERYERARQQVGADAAFLHIRDKVAWLDPSMPDPGKIPFWRLERTYGARWYLNPVSYVVIAAAWVSKRFWRNPATAR